MKTILRLSAPLFFLLLLTNFNINPIKSLNVIPYFTDIYESLIKVLIDSEVIIPYILSDSYYMYFNAIILGVIALLLSIVFHFAFDEKRAEKWHQTIRSILVFYLIYVWLTYGLNKIFGRQFMFPDENLLFTDLGQLSKDILFWSTMGTSKLYSVATGMAEVVVALLLIPKRSRFIGLNLSLLLALHIVLINFSFDISVKFFTMFLSVLSVYLLFPYRSKYALMLGVKLKIQRRRLLFKSILLTGIIGLVILPYTHEVVNHPQKGAYQVIDDSEISRVFVHRSGYLIMQNTYGDVFEYNEPWQIKGEQLQLKDVKLIRIEEISLDYLPIYEEGFHWFIDDYIQEELEF